MSSGRTNSRRHRHRNPEQQVDINGAVRTSGDVDCLQCGFLPADRQQGHSFAVAGIGAWA